MSEAYYVSPHQAKPALLDRQELKRAVEQFWADNNVAFPEVLKGDAHLSVIGRHVATFRFEDAIFALMSQAADLTPAWLTYTADKFVTVSNVKRSLTRPFLTSRLNKNGQPITMAQRLVENIDRWSGKPIESILTTDGIPLVAWHKQRLQAAIPDALVSDMSEFCKAWGGKADSYYDAYLSLFIAHGVLFEDYHGGESGEVLNGFTARVFEPAIERLERRFGVKPLVVALPWWPELGHYPDKEWLTNWGSCKQILRREAA